MLCLHLKFCTECKVSLVGMQRVEGKYALCVPSVPVAGQKDSGQDGRSGCVLAGHFPYTSIILP
jgi:hypothetical protein